MEYLRELLTEEVKVEPYFVQGIGPKMVVLCQVILHIESD